MSFAGDTRSCIGICCSLLADLLPQACSGLQASVLHVRAAAFRMIGDLDVALADLAQALQWEPSHVQCMRLRCEVQRKLSQLVEMITCRPRTAVE